VVGVQLSADREVAFGEALAGVAPPMRFMFRRALRIAEVGAAAQEPAKDVMVRELGE